MLVLEFFSKLHKIVTNRNATKLQLSSISGGYIGDGVRAYANLELLEDLMSDD